MICQRCESDVVEYLSDVCGKRETQKLVVHRHVLNCAVLAPPDLSARQPGISPTLVATEKRLRF
jgi:hypothetical protein